MGLEHAKDEIYNSGVSTMCDKWPQMMRENKKGAGGWDDKEIYLGKENMTSTLKLMNCG